MTNDEGDDIENGTIQDYILEPQHGAELITNPELLEPDTIVDEDRIVGRKQQQRDISRFYRKGLTGKPISNLLVHGPSGTGKSLITSVIAREVQKLALEREDIRLGIVHAKGRDVKSYDEAVYSIYTEIATQAGLTPELAKQGTSSHDKIHRFFEIADEHFDLVLAILDEVDLMVGQPYAEKPAYDRLLYKLTRSKEDRHTDIRISVTALTNDPTWLEQGEVDSRTLSSFSPRSIVFEDYTEQQLEQILTQRKDAFADGVLEPDTIHKASELGAQDHGDARQALKLLKRAGNLAEEKGDDKITKQHVISARESVDKDRVLSQLEILAAQKQYALYSLLLIDKLADVESKGVPAKPAYQVYEFIMNQMVSDMDPRTYQQFIKYMNGLETSRFIDSDTKHYGAGVGPIRYLSLRISVGAVENALQNSHVDQDAIDTSETKSFIDDVMSEFLERVPNPP